jgi:hypothetical protein
MAGGGQKQPDKAICTLHRTGGLPWGQGHSRRRGYVRGMASLWGGPRNSYSRGRGLCPFSRRLPHGEDARLERLVVAQTVAPRLVERGKGAKQPMLGGAPSPHLPPPLTHWPLGTVAGPRGPFQRWGRCQHLGDDGPCVPRGLVAHPYHGGDGAAGEVRALSRRWRANPSCPYRGFEGPGFLAF